MLGSIQYQTISLHISVPRPITNMQAVRYSGCLVLELDTMSLYLLQSTPLIVGLSSKMKLNKTLAEKNAFNITKNTTLL